MNSNNSAQRRPSSFFIKWYEPARVESRTFDEMAWDNSIGGWRRRSWPDYSLPSYALANDTPPPMAAAILWSASPDH